MRAVNLLPRDDARRRRKANPVVLASVSGAVILAALLAAAFLMESTRVTDRQNTLDNLRAELAATPPPPPAPAGQTELVTQQQQRLAALSAALSKRIAFDRVLREFALVLPGDVWLTSLVAQSPVAVSGSSSPEASTPGRAATSPFTINGYTYSQESVARLLVRLALVPDLRNVQLQKSAVATIGRRSVVQFTITAELRMPGAIA